MQHQLVVNHFKTKDALWRQVVSSIADEVSQEQAAILEHFGMVGEVTKGYCTDRLGETSM